MQSSDKPLGNFSVVRWLNPVAEAMELRVHGQITTEITDDFGGRYDLQAYLAHYDAATDSWNELLNFNTSRGSSDAPVFKTETIDETFWVGAGDMIVLTNGEFPTIRDQRVFFKTHDDQLFFTAVEVIPEPSTLVLLGLGGLLLLKRRRG